MERSKILEKLARDFLEIDKRSRVDGVLWRAPYTWQDEETKGYLRDLLAKGGFVVTEDAVGNLFGTMPGKETDQTILAGSHLDTVRNGGAYDGLYGVLAAIYAVQGLVEAYGQPKRNMAVVGLMEEEGSRYLGGYIGSKALVGALDPGDLAEEDGHGIALSQAMKDAGYQPHDLMSARRRDIAAFYELHIEQGPVLERDHLQIGLVESINGLLLLQVRIFGQQDHAGTTPMAMRKDALLHASKLIAVLDGMTADTRQPATATVGELIVKPGSSNVVPDFVQFTLDIRAGAEDVIAEVFQRVKKEVEKIEAAGLTVEIEVVLDEAPVHLNESLIEENEKICQAAGLSFRRMHSGAGHDSQILAPHIPTALLFVPCLAGKSHSPEEAMTNHAMMDGVEILMGIFFEKAWK